jgi:phosphate starvation-inducible PhoH-like protein
MRVLEGVSDIAICKLSASDVVRHELVSRIVEAYDKREKKPRSAGRAEDR